MVQRESDSESVACIECDLLVRIQELEEGARASCPRCGHLLTTNSPDGLTRSLAYAVASGLLLLLSNAFPFLAIQAKGLEQVMSLPRTTVELLRDGHATLAVLVGVPIIVVPAVILGILLAILVPLRRGRPAAWLVAAGRLLFVLSPWAMVEVFIIGVLVSLVKIGAMATVVIGISFWAYLGFAVCFTASLASLDRLDLWRRIEACTP